MGVVIRHPIHFLIERLSIKKETSEEISFTTSEQVTDRELEKLREIYSAKSYTVDTSGSELKIILTHPHHQYKSESLQNEEEHVEEVRIDPETIETGTEEPEPEGVELEQEQIEKKETQEESFQDRTESVDDSGKEEEREEEGEDEKIVCPECGDEFENGSGFGKHLNKENHIRTKELFKNEDGEIECPECGETVETPKDLSSHSGYHHDKRIVELYLEYYSELKPDEEDGDKQENEKLDPSTTCKYCGEKFDTEEDKNSHQENCVHKKNGTKTEKKRKQAIKTEFDRLKDNDKLPKTKTEAITKINNRLQEQGVLPENYSETDLERLLESSKGDVDNFFRKRPAQSKVEPSKSKKENFTCKVCEKSFDSSRGVQSHHANARYCGDYRENPDKYFQGGEYDYDSFSQLDKEMQKDEMWEFLDNETSRKYSTLKKNFWGGEPITDGKRDKLFESLVEELKKEERVEGPKQGIGFLAVDPEKPEHIPRGVDEHSLSGWTGQEFTDLQDVRSSEILLRVLKDVGPATIQEIGKEIFEAEDFNKFHIKRVLDFYLNGIIKSNEEDVTGETKYWVDKKIRERLEQDKPSLYQVLNSKKSGAYLCLDCPDHKNTSFDESKKAKRHRSDKGHFNWGVTSIVNHEMDDSDNWREAVV